LQSAGLWSSAELDNRSHAASEWAFSMKLFSKAAGVSGYRATGAVDRHGFFPNQYDLAAIALILAGLVLVVAGGRQMTAPTAALAPYPPPIPRAPGSGPIRRSRK